MQERPKWCPQQAYSMTAHFLPVLKAPLSMTKTKTLFSLETSVHVHFCCVAFLSCSALPCGRESWPGQYLLRLRHELVRGCWVGASNPAGDGRKVRSKSLLGQLLQTQNNLCLVPGGPGPHSSSQAACLGLDPHVPWGDIVAWRPWHPVVSCTWPLSSQSPCFSTSK